MMQVDLVGTHRWSGITRFDCVNRRAQQAGANDARCGLPEAISSGPLRTGRSTTPME